MARADTQTLDFIRQQLQRRERFDAVHPGTALTVAVIGVAGAAAASVRGVDFALGDLRAPLLHWLAVLICASAAYAVFSARSARSVRAAHLNAVARFAYSCQLIAMGTAALLTFALWKAGAVAFVPAAWLLCYGLGAWPASFVAGLPFRAMSIGFLACGLLAVIYPDAGTLLLGAGFGGMHAALGGLIWCTRRQ